VELHPIAGFEPAKRVRSNCYKRKVLRGVMRIYVCVYGDTNQVFRVEHFSGFQRETRSRLRKAGPFVPRLISIARLVLA
jgi:hypothetical protein